MGSVTVADWAKIKSMLRDLEKELGERLDRLDSEGVKGLGSRVEGIRLAVETMERRWEALEGRLSEVEANAPMSELSTGDILDMWRAADAEAGK